MLFSGLFPWVSPDVLYLISCTSALILFSFSCLMFNCFLIIMPRLISLLGWNASYTHVRWNLSPTGSAGSDCKGTWPRPRVGEVMKNPRSFEEAGLPLGEMETCGWLQFACHDSLFLMPVQEPSGGELPPYLKKLFTQFQLGVQCLNERPI